MQELAPPPAIFDDVLVAAPHVVGDTQKKKKEKKEKKEKPNKYNERVTTYERGRGLALSHACEDTGRKSKVDRLVESLRKRYPSWSVKQCVQKAEDDIEARQRALEDRNSAPVFTFLCTICQRSRGEHDADGRCPIAGLHFYSAVTKEDKHNETKTGKEYRQAVSRYDEDDDFKIEEASDYDDSEPENCGVELSFCYGTDEDGTKCTKRRCLNNFDMCSVRGIAKSVKEEEERPNPVLAGLLRDLATFYETVNE